MPRGVQAVNGIHENGDAPPPSTLAAQIVQNQTRPPARQQNGEISSFQELLHEILHNESATPETDLSVNVKLITVVAEAGLAPLADGNPFAQWDVRIPLAVDSIAVIEKTIKEQPEILFTSPRPGEPQLFLPLLARLVAACGRQKCEDLPISRLLRSILQALNANLDLWQNAHIVRHVVEECVNEALTSLEVPNTETAIKLPPARSVAKLWPECENAITLPDGCQTIIVDRAHLFMLILQFCSMKELPVPWRNDVQSRLQKLALPLRAQLETSKQWDCALQGLISLPNNLIILQHTLAEAPKAMPSLPTQSRIAKALIDALQRDSNSVKDYLLSPLTSLASSEVYESLHEDLKISLAIIIVRLCKGEEFPEPVQALQEALRQDNVMTDSDFQASFQKLSVKQPPAHCGPRRSKRRKVDGVQSDDLRATVIQRVTRLLTGIQSQDLSALPDVAPNAYRSLSETDQCAAWQALTDLTNVELDTALQVIQKLIDVPELNQSKQARVLSLLAVRACVAKSSDATCADLRRSDFGQICLRSLHSSTRDIRITAGQCLSCFLRDDLPTELRNRNRKTVLEYLHAVSDRDVACEQETLVSAWGHIALTCENSELNLALLRLVEYLGHSNPLISGLAFEELEKLADAKGLSQDELFRPFWNSIAFSVVKDLHSRPQKAQQLCDLLASNMNEFLSKTQQEIIPHLVLTKRKDVLNKVATACGHAGSIRDLLFQPRTNLTATLALLLIQPESDPEDTAMATLVEVAGDFAGTDFAGLVKVDPILIGCNMLKHIGDEAESHKSRAYQAFQTFTSIAQRQPGQRKAHSKSSRVVAEYFEKHILGIMTLFSDVLENIHASYSTTEKIRCVRAIAEMIIISKREVGAALPQIRAALQSAMEHEDLCEASFGAWLNLLSVLEGDDIVLILDQTFALILRHWQTFSSNLQERAHKSLDSLVQNHNQILRENVMTLPSLGDIDVLSKLAHQIDQMKETETVESNCSAFAKRLKDESRSVVLRALEELPPFLAKHQDFINESASSEQPPAVLSELLRAILDATVEYASENADAADLCGKSLGIIGCLDPNRVDATRKKRRALVISNFDRADEVIDWVIVLLEDVVVQAFKSNNNARAQGFLAYVMQELLRFCGFNDGTVLRPRASQAPSSHQKWMNMPEHVRITLTPFVNSRYVLASNNPLNVPNRAYPAFSPDSSHSTWLRSLVYDLLFKAKGENAQMVFPLLARIIRGHDLSIAGFMLPYTMLNVILGGTVPETKAISDEILAVLRCQPSGSSQQETVKLCSESVFNALDYMSVWLQEKKKELAASRAATLRTGSSPSGFNEESDMAQIDTVERFLASIPAELIATRAVMCGSYARALFNWEQYIRRKRPLIPSSRPPRQFSDDQVLYDKLQDIYAEIDEPDGLEGISAHLTFLNEEQQAMQHAKAGRWTAAQAWYEVQLAKDQQNDQLEERLLRCFQETGRYEPLLKYADSFLNARTQDSDTQTIANTLLPSILEAQWMIGDIDGMKTSLSLDRSVCDVQSDFNVGVANLLAMLVDRHNEAVSDQVKALRTLLTESMTVAQTSSVQTIHGDLRKLHVLHEIETLYHGEFPKTQDVRAVLERRLAVVGSYVTDKQYILGVRRVVMNALDSTFSDLDLGSSWLTTAKLARKSGNTEHAYNAVLKAYECGSNGAKIEEARLLWHDGHQRHAINALEAAITSGMFEGDEMTDEMLRPDESTSTTRSSTRGNKQNVMLAKVHLLLAKWLDASGQRQHKDMTEKYQYASKNFQRWEKGHYYLGKHYQKLLDAEKGLSREKQSQQFLSGELVRLVIENLARSLPFGNKYWHESIPKMLTLWLDLGSSTMSKPRGEDQAIFERRVKSLSHCNFQVRKYYDRVPPYVFYSALPQMLSRISHPNSEVWKELSYMITRIAQAHPNQALWSLLAVLKSRETARADRSLEIINRLKDPKTRAKTDGNTDLRVMIAQSQRLCDGLLRVCEVPWEKAGPDVKLTENLGFNQKLTPCQLVVPIELTLTARLSGGATLDTIKRHKPFVQDKITIHSFSEQVLVLSSLQKPRKLTARGSDGKQYGLLCKPKDDLRKDQRLMEFNGIISRALKRDPESSKRRLYVKTYAVTPLSEESGIIEWVEGIKPMRDIVLNAYYRRGIRPNYTEIKSLLDRACVGPEHAHLFSDMIQREYPPVLHEWFTEVYPEPEAWFAARLRYARTAAVMSITGHVLGLGDRHGENILLEENNGGIFHVDFNCLFDKGLTFDKPELVPFRLTHNMVDAMGPYGYEGPFRKSSELTLGLLRQSKDTLMTVLETFLYDPTTDFIGLKKKRGTAGVPETPQEILDSVEGKLRGLLRGEKVPLGVEGYVDALIREATNPHCLASMYIGWCAFL